MDKKIYKTIGFYIFIVTFITFVYFIFQMMKLNIIPKSLLLVVGLIIFLIVILGFVLLFKCKILGNILLVIVLFISGFGGIYLNKTHKVLENVTMDEESKSSSTFYLIGLKDFKGSISKLGMLSIGNTSLQKLAVEHLDFEYNIVDFDSYYTLGEGLYDHSVDAILVADNSYTLLKELQNIKDEDIQVIDKFTVSFDTNVKSKSVEVLEQPFTVFISGKDSEDLDTSISRSDVNLLLTINPKEHQILMLGIPRDFYVEQPCQNNQKDKLTHAGVFGIDGSIGTIERLFNIPVNYYVQVNFNSLVNVVDALGGITVSSPYDFVSLHGDYHFVEGENKMNGKQALGFVRERYSFEDGDRERSRNQMRVLKAIIDKAMSPSIIKNYPKLLDTLSDSFKTNMSSKEITSFIKGQMNDLKDWDIQQIQVNGSSLMTVSPALGFEVYMMDPDMDTVHNAEKLIQKSLNGELITKEDIDNHNSLVSK